MLTLQSEAEMLGKVTTLVVAAQHEQSRWKVEFQREQIQHALHTTHTHSSQ